MKSKKKRKTRQKVKKIREEGLSRLYLSNPLSRLKKVARRSNEFYKPRWVQYADVNRTSKMIKSSASLWKHLDVANALMKHHGPSTRSSRPHKVTVRFWSPKLPSRRLYPLLARCSRP